MCVCRFVSIAQLLWPILCSGETWRVYTLTLFTFALLLSVSLHILHYIFIGTSPIANWQCPDNKDRIAFSRNKTGFIALNRGSSSWNIQGLQTSLEAGLYCNVLVSDEVSTSDVV